MIICKKLLMDLNLLMFQIKNYLKLNIKWINLLIYYKRELKLIKNFINNDNLCISNLTEKLIY